MPYNKPFAEEINTESLCDYGCGQAAKYKFGKGKVCCSKHFNSCPAKRKAFAESQDHSSNAAKSLKTRTELGITKSSQVKAGKTRRENGHYERLAKTMQDHWATHPWQNNLQCPLLPYKNSGLLYQGTYEYEFLEELEAEHGLDWVIGNVKRGPSIWYTDPEDQKQKLYISDFIIGNTIFEIKSGWTWNKHGKDLNLERKNLAKLTECVNQQYNVVLVLNQQRIEYERVMGRAL